MGIEYILYDRDHNEISAIVAELKANGYRVNHDFDFAYHPGQYNWSTLEQIPRKTVFTFYNEELALWCTLRWS